MKLFKSVIIVFYIILGIYKTTSVKQTDWINNLIKYIQKDNKEYQVLILFDKNESPKVGEIIRRISRQIPSLEISLQEVNTNKSLNLSHLPSVIIIIHFSKVSGNKAQLYSLIEFASRLSGTRTRPKCLLFLSHHQDHFFYQKLLRHMWDKRFLDVTILEFLETITKEESYSLKKIQGLMIQIPLIHHYNPFINISSRFKYSNSVSWFPDKTRNLHEHELKVGLIEIPPFVFLERNSKGDIVRQYGLDLLLTRELAKAMNFRILWYLSSEENDWGSSINCTRESSTGFLYKLMNNELDFIGFENGRYGACYEGLYEHSRSTKYARVSIVVPILRRNSSPILTNWNILNAVLFASMLLGTWIISYLLLRKPETLNLLQLGRIVLGTTAPEEPQKLTERIVFGSILLSCMLQASFIYTVITDNSLQIDMEPELETIKDVVSSDLLPIIGQDYYRAFYEFTEGDTRRLLVKSNKGLVRKTCLMQLLKEKNVVCVIRSEIAQAWSEDHKNSCGQPVMKVLNEVLRSTVSGMNMEAGSPYVKRFDEIIERLIESGIVGIWQRIKFNRSSVVINPDEPCSQTRSEATYLRMQITYIFLVGYSCAIIAFFSEVIYAYFTK